MKVFRVAFLLKDYGTINIEIQAKEIKDIGFILKSLYPNRVGDIFNVEEIL